MHEFGMNEIAMPNTGQEMLQMPKLYRRWTKPRIGFPPILQIKTLGLGRRTIRELEQISPAQVVT
jgi:hypothetical protein